MQIRQMIFRKKESLAALFAGVVLVGYIGFLLVANYLSQVELRKSAVDRLIEDMKSRAAAVSYFASERINDLKELAAGKELAFFFANKALGMSMQYGLSSNLQDIASSFDRLINEKKLGTDPIYDRIDFISTIDDLHVKRTTDRSPLVMENGLQEFLFANPSGVGIKVHSLMGRSTMTFSLPYVYKEALVGHIVTWVGADVIYRHLQVAGVSLKKVIFIGYEGGYLPLPAGVEDFVRVSSLPPPSEVLPRDLYPFVGLTQDDHRNDFLALRIPVENTPFFLLAVMPHSELFGRTSLWRLFLLLGALSLVVLFSILALLYIKDQNLILRIRLDESNSRQGEIARKNLQLQQEILDRHAVEKALRASEKKYRELHESMRDGYICTNSEGKIIEYNPAFREMLGFSEEEMVSWVYDTWTLKEWRDLEGRIVQQQVLARGYSDLYEKEYRRRDGVIFPAELRTYRLTDGGGKVLGTWSIVRDISDRKQAERELQRAKDAAESANRAKSQFLANMSHELRTPLNHIIGFTELVLYKHFGDLNATQEEYLNDSLQSSLHLLALINDILDISKVEAGKVDLNLSDVHLKKLLENSLNMIKETVVTHRIQVTTDLQGLPEILRVDERKLKQVLYNLLSNAAKFTPDGGSIALTARPVALERGFVMTGDGRKIELPVETIASGGAPAAFIEIIIRDTGIGLRESDLDRIFEPFTQVESSSTRKYQGTGLGLSLSKNLVELHRGRIWAESEGADKGAAFHVLLPVCTG